MSHQLPDRSQAYQRALTQLRESGTDYGFKASTEDRANYPRVWGRDSMICSLAALMTDDEILWDQVRRSLETLIAYQGPYGQIPSNVDAAQGAVSYGGSAGRVDASLWFLVGFAQYVKRTGDRDFLAEHWEAYEKTLRLMHIYEFNNKHLIYIPRGGDWADEYPHDGYVLYDEVLYYLAVREYIDLLEMNGEDTTAYRSKAEAIKRRIQVNFWPLAENVESEAVYDKSVFQKAAAQLNGEQQHLCAYFNPSGYNGRFDGFGNVLALVGDLVQDEWREHTHSYIRARFSEETRYLLPAFSPPITREDPEWRDLESAYMNEFRNEPGEYHNGGLWPMITGFYAAALGGDREEGERRLDAVNRANSRSGEEDDHEWCFYEFISGNDFTPGGARYQAWSAAGTVLAHESVVNGKKVLV